MITPTTVLSRFHATPSPMVAEIASVHPRVYARYAEWHYLAGRPATIVLALEATVDQQPAGLLTISMPVLNADWRSAWSDLLRPTSRSERAQVLNASVRTISRVIVDPRFRGMGVATALVRHYLACPSTRRTEALSAMGDASPFFERAGMQRVEREQSASTRTLQKAIAEAGHSPADLVLKQGRLKSSVRQAIRRWSKTSGGRRRIAQAAWPAQCRAAARHLLARPIAYIHESPAPIKQGN